MRTHTEFMESPSCWRTSKVRYIYSITKAKMPAELLDNAEDGTEIYEVAEGSRTEDWIDEDSDLDVLRLVFVKDSAKSPYRFAGVFKSGKMEFCKHTYCRIASKVKLIGDPVTKIELLDDNR